MRLKIGIICALLAVFVLPVSAAAQDSACEIALMPIEGRSADAQFADAGAFLDSVYDGRDGHLKTLAGMPVRAVLCRRDDLIPTMRDLPVLKTGMPLSLSQDFDSTTSGLLTLYDAGADFKAEYSGPPLSPEQQKRLRDTLEIFNFQKFIK